MCNITKIYRFKDNISHESLIEMNDTIKQIGPENGDVKLFENTGLVLVESMALGTPVAAYSYEAIPEILKKTNSILFNPDSEIEIK